MAPLTGKTLTSSGFSQPETDSLRSAVESLGGVFADNLVASTTHLVIAEGGTAKHRYAVLAGIRAVRPAWVDACRRHNRLVDEFSFTVPPFEAVIVCCTGLDLGHKKRVKDVCDRLGGKYSRTLGPSCTHLVAKRGSEGGRKFEYAKKQGLYIVGGEWVDECSKRGGVVDETPFLLDEAVETKKSSDENGVAHVKKAAQNDNVGVIQKEDNILPSADIAEEEEQHGDEAVFYLTTSPMQCKTAYTDKLGKILKMVADLGGTISTELSPRVNFVVVVHTPITKARVPDIELVEQQGVMIIGMDWVTKCAETGWRRPKQSLEKSAWNVTEVVEESQGLSLPTPDVTSNVFQGLRCALGPLMLFDSTIVERVGEKLQRGKGKILHHDAKGVITSGVATHVVCAENMPAGSKRLVDMVKNGNKKVMMVTPTWIDACLNEGNLVDPIECVLYRPVMFETPLPHMKHVALTISGFYDGEGDRKRENIAKIARLLGMRYSERMRKTATTHLVSADTASNKVKKAKEWGIHVVGWRWVVACAREGCVVNERDFPVEIVQAPEQKQTPRTPRRSQRLKTQSDSPTQREGSPMAERIQLFKRFTEGLEQSDVVEAMDVPMMTRRRGRSRSVSLDAEREWSMDASQSQAIFHRDLTPPGSPHEKGSKRRKA